MRRDMRGYAVVLGGSLPPEGQLVDHPQCPGQEGNMIGALIERRANVFHTVELQDEIVALKAQILGIAPRLPLALKLVE